MVDKLDSAKVVAFVHAKGTSERLPGKNLKVFGDRPLICHAIANALAARLVDAVVIDSEDDEILRVGREAGAIPLKRPAELATNETTGDDLARWQAGSVPYAESILQVVPTCPFTLPASIGLCIMGLADYASVTGVRHDQLYTWRAGWIPEYRGVNGGIPNSVDLPTVTWETCGLYGVRAAYARGQGQRVAMGCGCRTERGTVGLSQIEAIDINTQEDFDFAEIVWKGMQC